METKNTLKQINIFDEVDEIDKKGNIKRNSMVGKKAECGREVKENDIIKMIDGKIYFFNTICEQANYFKMLSLNILEKLDRKEKVSRWEVMLNRITIRTLVRPGCKFEHLRDEVEDLIDSAKESL